MRTNSRVAGSVLGVAMPLGGLGATASADPDEDPGVSFQSNSVGVPVRGRDSFHAQERGIRELVNADVFGAPLIRIFDPCP